MQKQTTSKWAYHFTITMNILAQDNRVDSGHLFLLFFLIFFSIVSFNIELIEN